MKARWLLFGGTFLALSSCFDFEGYTLETTVPADASADASGDGQADAQPDGQPDAQDNDCMTFCAKKVAANCPEGLGFYDTCEEECATEPSGPCVSQSQEVDRCHATQATVTCTTAGYPTWTGCAEEEDRALLCLLCQPNEWDDACASCRKNLCCDEPTASAWGQCAADHCSTACTPAGVGTVECGGMACSDICCVSQTVSGQWAGTCVSDAQLCCTSTSCLALGCDGPEDCDTGEVCCHFSNSDGAAAWCTSTLECQSGSATGYACHTDLDCLGTHRCTAFSSYLPLNLCSSS